LGCAVKSSRYEAIHYASILRIAPMINDTGGVNTISHK